MLTLGDIERPREIRLGKRWVTDERGKKSEIAPLDLTLREFRQWLFQQTFAAATEGILEPTEKREHGQPTENRGKAGETALDALIAAEEILEQERLLHAVYSVASPKQGQLLELLGRGLDLPTAASTLRMDATTARVHLHRLRKKAHL